MSSPLVQLGSDFLGVAIEPTSSSHGLYSLIDWGWWTRATLNTENSIQAHIH